MKNKKQMTLCILCVGVFLVVMASVLFATTTWQYLPVLVKMGILAVLSIGGYVGAEVLYGRERMPKTQTALYYLATTFMGLFVIMLLAECNLHLPESVHYAQYGNDFGFGISEQDYLAAFCMVCLALLIRLLRNRTLLDSGMFFVGMHLSLVLCHDLYGEYDEWDFATLLMTVNAVWFTLQLYDRFGKIFLRVLNSISILACIWGAVQVFLPLHSQMKDVRFENQIYAFTFFVLALGVMVWLNRRELRWMLSIYGVFFAFIQLLYFGGYPLLFSYQEHTPSIYLPFALVWMGAMCLYVLWHVYGQERVWKLAAVGAQGITLVTVCIASRISIFYGAWWMVTMAALLSVGLSRKSIKACQVWCSLAASAFVAAMHSFTIPHVYSQFFVEWECLLILIGVVIVKRIWYDKKQIMEHVQFGVICLLDGILLLSNLCGQEMDNVFILGVVCVGAIFLGVIYGMRKYVWLFSVTLFLLVAYVTRSLWMQLAWWVYLLIAGSILIAIAVKREREE